LKNERLTAAASLTCSDIDSVARQGSESFRHKMWVIILVIISLMPVLSTNLRIKAGL